MVAIAVLVFVSLIYFGTRPEGLGNPSSGASPTPTVSRTPPSLPPEGEYANSIRFESDRVAGNFTINESHWDHSTLVVDITLSVERGSLNYQFLAMDMVSGEVTLADPPSEPYDLPGGTLTAGQTERGRVRITKSPGDTQVLLGDTFGRNLTMLAVKGP